jgi:capsular polysaccharide biosynthesis protein
MTLAGFGLRGLLVRVLLVMVLAAVAGVAALIFSQRQPERYDASVRLSYAARPDMQALGLVDPTDNTVRLNTEAAELESFDLAVATSRAVPELDMTPDTVADNVTAAALPDTQVVELAAQGTTAGRAVRLLEVYRDTYLERRSERERERVQDAERALRRRLADLPRTQRDGALASSLRAQLGALAVVRRSGTGIPEAIEGVRRPTAASAPRTARNVLFGVLFGVAAGIGLVAVLPSRRRTAPESSAEEPAPPEVRPSNGARSHRRRKATKR